MATTRAVMNVLARSALLLGALAWRAHATRVAVLPFLPEDGSPAAEGVMIASKLVEKMEGMGEVFGVDIDEFRDLLRRQGLHPSRLLSPAGARAIGKLLGADGVVMGSFAGKRNQLLASAQMVHVPSGKISPARRWALERDIVVQPPAFSIDAPVLDEEDPYAMRDALTGSGCDGAGERVDRLERRILDLKARYWALQLSRGVHMAGIKFNPGSTITDPELKREFYERIRQWQRQDEIPELTPLEIKEFADTDELAIRIARRCGIL